MPKLRAFAPLLWALGAASLFAAAPDPHTVQRYRTAWRYPQAGWTVVHIEGEPYQRGLQHGHLLAPEITAYIRALALYWGPAAPRLAWDQTRNLVNLVFLRGFTSEQLQEMKGIADGAAAEGAKYEGRAVDLIDIAVLNTTNEIDSIDSALQATPTGLESLALNPDAIRPPPAAVRRARQRPLRCSAFAAIGPATRDGKLVFGHVTMYDLYPANFYNIWMDVKPSQGHHFVMQTIPGGMHSGMDYSINDAGILMSETTLDQARAALAGVSLASRIRQAEQYASSIEEAAEMLSRNNNGLCTTEWILADIHRNEIALLTLGTNKSVIHRSSRQEWIGGIEGFYWSDNNIKDEEVRLQTAGALEGRPSPVAAYAPSKRDTVWLRMYDEAKGKMDAETARRMITTPEIVAAWAADAKYTTADMAARFETWASFGPPVGSVWRPSALERKNFPAIKPLVNNPWTVLSSVAPPSSGEDDEEVPEDRPNLLKLPDPPVIKKAENPAWHGTLRPASDADIWLTTAFANYERIVALEQKQRELRPGGKPLRDDWEELGVEISYYRSLYAHGSRNTRDFPLADTKSNVRDDNWYLVVSGKGVLLLHTLRGLVGKETFDRAMDEYGRANAGKAVTSAGFQQFLQSRTQRPLNPVFDWWLRRTGLPHLALLDAKVARAGAAYQTTVDLDTSQIGPLLPVPVTVETETGEVTEWSVLDAQHGRVVVKTAEKPERVVVDKYGMVARSNGSPYTILTFDNELEKALIVYGTQDEEVGNREAARMLQQSLRRREHNVQPVVKADREVTEEDVRTHHLLLVGRPSTNAMSARFASQVPVRFGPASFEIRDEIYAHPETAVIVAGDNPVNRRFSIVMIAGLSSLATYQIIPQFEEDVFTYAQVVIVPYGSEEDSFVAPLKELSRDLN